MHMSSFGRWVVRLSVVAALGLAALSSVQWYTADDVVWTARVTTADSVAR
jgi:hypothetical protein